jgi:hypothetical protein
MDIRTLLTGGTVSRLDTLILHKRYRIQYLRRIPAADGVRLQVKLQFSSAKDDFFTLPPNYTRHITAAQISLINNESLFIDLVLVDYTREGFPYLEFIYAGGVQL